MLEEVQKLGGSVTLEQIDELRLTLGHHLYGFLKDLLDSKSEDEATKRVEAFVEEAKKSPLKILKARRLLDDDQKALIMKFMES